jgi:S1-C subfamily serine protease
VRNVSCLGVATGSGFALTKKLLITNRHVIAGADRLEVSTWDGRTLAVPAAAVGVLGDLGLVVVEGDLPLPGSLGPAPHAGDPITVVGYPQGGPLTLANGIVIDRIDGRDYDVEGAILRVSARVQPGNSGGPVLDRQGRIVALVYAVQISTGFGLAIPVDTFRRLASTGGFETVPPCGGQ